MANQQLKRLLRRRPEMEEAEFELLQSRVLSRLARATAAPGSDDPAAVDEPERDATADPSTNGTASDDLGGAQNGGKRVKSVRVTTYELPATAVGVMADPEPPIWELPTEASGRSEADPTAKVMTTDVPRAETAAEAMPIDVPKVEPAAEAMTIAEPDERQPLDWRAAQVLDPDPDAVAIGERFDADRAELDDEVASFIAMRAPVAAPAPPPATAKAATRAPRASRTRPPSRPVPKAASAPVAPVPYCPYCALRLDPPPELSRRCPRCRERIIVKRVDGRAVYLTEASVAVFEAERRRMANAGRWTRERDRWLKVAAGVDAPAARIARLSAAPLSAEVVAASEALYMTTVERSFRAAKRERRWEDASRILREHALVLYRFAGSPVPPPETIVRLHRDGAACQLRGIEELTRQAELVSAKCCDVCRADDGRTFTIRTELRTPRLPHDGCPRGLCRCDWYLPVRDQTMVRRHLRRRARAGEAVGSGDGQTTVA